MPGRQAARPRALHQNLDTAYVNLAALLRHLQQRDFAGRVHVELDEYDADIFLAARERPRVRERDHVTGRVAEGDAALQRVIVRASEPGGLVSVYEGETDPARADDWGGTFSAAAPAATGGGETTHTRDEIDRRVVLQLGGEVIAAVERAVGASGGEFAAHFQAARAEVSDRFPFLASLSACVEYAGGEARLARGVSVAEFAAGTCEALRLVVERASAAGGEAARGVRREAARELAALEEGRPRSLARFNFSPQLERIAGLRWT
ncbi:MAG: hypothetical protein LC800_06030 [Acidobacteria bacterium]|nr:hypothetical protein [Acidobacteriota bacterium]